MKDYELYYGLPQELWDGLCEKAEDILQEECLGNHLVGIYPAGNRIYGIDSAPPGLMCLYVDSVEPIIDPLSDYHNKDGFKVYHVNHDNSPIIMVDLYKWVRWLCSNIYRNSEEYWKFYAMLNVIPFSSCIHEEESVGNILGACYKAMEETGFLHIQQNTLTVRNEGSYQFSEQLYSNITPPRFLYNRTLGFLQSTLTFIPNINEDWDDTIKSALSGDKLYRHSPAFGTHIDKTICKRILNNNGLINTEDDMHFAKRFDPSLIDVYTRYKYSISQKTLKKISTEVMNFYRFQL